MEHKKENEFEKSYKYISKDTTFKNKLKSYFPDLTSCEKLNFSHSEFVEPITLNDFPIWLLRKTELLNDINDFDNLDKTEQIKVYDSIHLFSKYPIELNKNQVDKTDCEIRLTFAKKVNNRLPIKYIIIDKNVDPRIDYKPRKGIYIVEFNEENTIIERGYLILSH
ncbi:hypothetical protein [Psychroserpens sp. S379A]|uniref:hypothetical protein n=1 Tax=Psychroserpens sp. S379A TaxID=3415137 RepID=UPI003C79B545